MSKIDEFCLEYRDSARVEADARDNTPKPKPQLEPVDDLVQFACQLFHAKIVKGNRNDRWGRRRRQGA